MNTAFLRDERLADLLVKQATEGLTPAEKDELGRLLARQHEADPELIERVAAALSMAGNLGEEELPTGLRQRVEAEGRRLVASSRATVTDISSRRGETRPTNAHASQWAWFAMAASLVLAVLGWWPRLRDTIAPEPSPEVAVNQQPAPAPQPTHELTAAEKREAMLAKGESIVQSPWSATGDAAAPGVTGDVVWDNGSQTGYLRFSGLAPNDPSKSQYQLWIFDANQDDRYPIDGGVFDVLAGQTDVIVPIQAKLDVKSPAMFAVTIEKPGGVVVSGREHIVALAKVAAG